MVTEAAWPPGESAMAARVRAHDWAATPLGPAEQWSAQLKAAAMLVLDNGFPAALAWGDRLTMIYNDGFVPILGDKPDALGRAFDEVWAESWNDVGPFAQRALAGEASYLQDFPVVVNRTGSPETAWFTFSYSPLRNADGSVAGMLDILKETTSSVMARAERRESEDRFRAFVTASADVVYRMSPDWSEMWRLEGRDFLRDTDAPSDDWLDVYIHADDQVEVRAAIDEAIRNRAIFELEHRVFRADGSLGWTRSRAVPILDTDGRIREWLGTASDVTEQREMQDALRAREIDLARVQRIGEVGGLDIDVANGLNSIRSPEYLRLHGLSGDSLYETHADWLARVHPEDRADAEEVLFAALNGDGDSYESEYRIIRPSDGETRWIQARADIQRDAYGKAIRLLGARLDVTERKRLYSALQDTGALQAFQLRLSDALRSVSDAGALRTLACRLLGEQLGAARAYYVEYDAESGAGVVADDYAAPGLPSLAGRYPREVFATAFERAASARTWVVRDVAADAEVAVEERNVFLAQGITASINIPLFREEKLRAMLCVADPCARNWTPREIAMVEDTAERLWAAVERARAEERLTESEARLRLLVAELQHRVRNILTVVRSVFGRTFEGGGQPEEMADHFRGRLDALARTQIILTRTIDRTVDLENLIREELLSVGAQDSDRIRIAGPDVRIGHKMAESLGLAIHEMTTNALKYGALKAPDAQLDIRWSVNMHCGEAPTIDLKWIESGVPAVAVRPLREGFGRELIEEALPYRLGGTSSLEFKGGGIVCSISVPLRGDDEETATL